MDNSMQALKDSFRQVGKICKPAHLLIIMAEIYGEQGKKETKRIMDETAQKLVALPENKV